MVHSVNSSSVLRKYRHKKGCPLSMAELNMIFDLRGVLSGGEGCNPLSNKKKWEKRRKSGGKGKKRYYYFPNFGQFL